MRPNLFLEYLTNLLVKEGEVMLHVARGRLGKLRRVAVPLLKQIRAGSFDLLKCQRHGSLILLPVQEVSIVSVFALEALD